MAGFKDRVAVVTGSSSGIGSAITLALAAEGATLCLVGRKPGTSTVPNADKSHQKIFHYQANLTLDDDILGLATQLERDFGTVDILVHSAGVLSLGSIETASVKDLDEQYRINLRAPYFLTKQLLPMIKLRQGQVVFVNSSVGLNARANVSQYAATKLALKAVADSLRDEVNIHGIRVLSVFLGRTATPMQALVHKIEGKEYRPERLIAPEDAAEMVVAALRLPRSAEVTEIHIRPMAKPQA